MSNIDYLSYSPTILNNQLWIFSMLSIADRQLLFFVFREVTIRFISSRGNNIKRHRIELRFGVYRFEDMNHSELTSGFGVMPAVQHFKGTAINPKLPQGKIAKENAWIIVPSGCTAYDDFETQMKWFLSLANDKIAVFQKMCEKYHCEFSCAIFLVPNCGESTPWVHLGDEYNEIFGKLNVHFDLDLYC